MQGARAHIVTACATAAAYGLAFCCAGCEAKSAASAAANADRAAGEVAAPAGPPRDVNVVMFLIDTLRADRVGAYGYEKPTTPNIDALAEECVTFEQAYAAASWTLPSVPSIFTSTFPCEHGLVVDRTQLNEAFETLAQRFKRAGYHTTSFYANPYLGEKTGLSRGFDLARQNGPRRDWHTDGSHVETWLDEKPPGPYFLYIHNIEPHDPWKMSAQEAAPFGKVAPAAIQRIRDLTFRYKPLLRADWKEQRERGGTDNTALQDRYLNQLHELLPEHNALYDAAVRRADQRVGSVVETLKRRGEWEQTLFVLLSDHGEEMAEHGAYIHGQSLYEELTRVPLLIHFPGAEFARRRVTAVVSLVDILPTIFDYVNRPQLSAGARGVSLMPLARGERPHGAGPRVVAVRINEKKYYKPWAETRGDINVALRLESLKAVWNHDFDRLELYDLARDPHEARDLSAERAPLAAELGQAARAWYEGCGAQRRDALPVELSAEDLRNIGALGYVDVPDADDEQKP